MNRRETTERALRRITAARVVVERTWIGDLAARARALDVVTTTTLFSSTLLLSVLPLIIIVSAIGDERIDDDLSRHIGLDSKAAGIVHSLFNHRPISSPGSVIIAAIFGFAGTMVAVGYIQTIYERAWDLDHVGWGGIGRRVAWVFILLATLLLESVTGKPAFEAGGRLAHLAVGLVELSVFFAFTMHFLLGGRVPWRAVWRPALVTAVLWLLLALISSLLFSDQIVSDSHLYGTIGVVFTLLVWFALLGAVIVLGVLAGVVWQERSERARARDRDRAAT